MTAEGLSPAQRRKLQVVEREAKRFNVGLARRDHAMWAASEAGVPIDSILAAAGLGPASDETAERVRFGWQAAPPSPNRAT